jgi:hypothetical protein
MQREDVYDEIDDSGRKAKKAHEGRKGRNVVPRVHRQRFFNLRKGS